MWPIVVVVIAPTGETRPRIGQGLDGLFAQAFVSEPGSEAFDEDESVLGCPAGLDVAGAAAGLTLSLMMLCGVP